MPPEEAAAATEAPPVPLEIELSDTGPCKKRMRVRIPKERAEAAERQEFDRFLKAADIPGFRRGRAPIQIVEKRYGKDLREELKQRLVSSSFGEAVEAKGLRPMGAPDIDKVEWTAGEGITFEATLEVKPDFEPKDYLGIPLGEASTEVHPNEIDAVIEQLRFQNVPYRVLGPGEAARKGDQVIARVSLEAGETRRSRENVPLYVSPGNVLGIPLGDLEAALDGAVPGGVLEREAPVPADHPDEALRGKTVRVRLEFREVKRADPPSLDDAWAKTHDAEGLEDLRERIRIELRVRKSEKAEEDARRRIEEHLLKTHDFELPAGVLEKWHEVSLERIRVNLRLQGLPEDRVDEELQRVKDASKDAVVRELRRTLILERIAEKENLRTTGEDLEARIAEMARANRTRPAVIRAILEERDLEGTIRAEIREEKTMRYLREKAAP